MLFEGTTGNPLVKPGRPVTPQRREAYITHWPPPNISVSVLLHTLTGGSLSSLFRSTRQDMCTSPLLTTPT